MKIGIVGGTGNISQPIVRLLLAKGHEVVLFNRGQNTKAPDGVRVIRLVIIHTDDIGMCHASVLKIKQRNS